MGVGVDVGVQVGIVVGVAVGVGVGVALGAAVWVAATDVSVGDVFCGAVQANNSIAATNAGPR
jgi:hypothetical protein